MGMFADLVNVADAWIFAADFYPFELSLERISSGRGPEIGH